MQGARRRSNARSIRRGAQRRSWALFVQTLRGDAWRGPPQRPRQGNGAAQAGLTIALPGLALLRLRLARSPALLRALRIVMLFVCGSRRASRPAQQRRGPMGFCISLLTRVIPLRGRYLRKHALEPLAPLIMNHVEVGIG